MTPRSLAVLGGRIPNPEDPFAKFARIHKERQGAAREARALLADAVEGAIGVLEAMDDAALRERAALLGPGPCRCFACTPPEQNPRNHPFDEWHECCPHLLGAP